MNTIVVLCGFSAYISLLMFVVYGMIGSHRKPITKHYDEIAENGVVDDGSGSSNVIPSIVSKESRVSALEDLGTTINDIERLKGLVNDRLLNEAEKSSDDWTNCCFAAGRAEHVELGRFRIHS